MRKQILKNTPDYTIFFYFCLAIYSYIQTMSGIVGQTRKRDFHIELISFVPFTIIASKET
jgi:hypothetical protein